MAYLTYLVCTKEIRATVQRHVEMQIRIRVHRPPDVWHLAPPSCRVGRTNEVWMFLRRFPAIRARLSLNIAHISSKHPLIDMSFTLQALKENIGGRAGGGGAPRQHDIQQVQHRRCTLYSPGVMPVLPMLAGSSAAPCAPLSQGPLQTAPSTVPAS